MLLYIANIQILNEILAFITIYMLIDVRVPQKKCRNKGVAFL
jgi:hypothetical protein